MFLSFLTSVSDKHGNKNKTTIVSQPWKIVLETTIKGQSFQVVLDNEAFFLVKQTGFYIVLPLRKKIKLQLDIFLSLLLIKKEKKSRWKQKKKSDRPSFKAALTFTLK